MSNRGENYIRCITTICQDIDPSFPDNCLSEGWDGYGAVAFTKEMADRAVDILNKLYWKELITDTLSVTPMPDGEFDFEWYVDQNHRVSIIPDKLEDGNINYIWLYKNSDMEHSKDFGRTNSIEELYPLVKSIINPERKEEYAEICSPTRFWDNFGNETT